MEVQFFGMKCSAHSALGRTYVHENCVHYLYDLHYLYDWHLLNATCCV